MDGEDLKLEYFTQQLEKGVKNIFAAQAQAAASNIYADGDDSLFNRSGALRQALETPRYTIATAGGGLQLTSLLPEYVRFVDMKNHGNRVIYNKHLWGVLYKETMSDIKYEFRDWLEQHYGDTIRSALS